MYFAKVLKKQPKFSPKFIKLQKLIESLPSLMGTITE